MRSSACIIAFACLLHLLAASNCRSDESAVDISHASILLPPNATPRRHKAATMLIEEVQKRSQIRWTLAERADQSQPQILLGTEAELAPLAADLAPAPGPEGYRIQVGSSVGSTRITIVGRDDRGVFYGVGKLLRTLRMTRQQISVPADLSIVSVPHTMLRGHQLGYRPKTNSYDGWTVALWEQYIRDLVVFGANAIELIPPRSDDAADSPHFTLPPMQMMVEMSRIADEYGLDVWVWYPAMDRDYADPKTVQFALDEWAAVFNKLPRLDAVFVPGGDPGHTRPKYLFDLLEKQTENLHRSHPNARMWMSPQSFNQQWFEEFLDLLKTNPPWLSGIVYGPEIRLSLHEFRQVIPDRYPIRHYPDITHCLRCQYPVPDWDVAFAATEGREPINPRPQAMANIARLSKPDSVGFITYSEGCNDDVNKMIWSAIGWDEQADVAEVLREYSRYFIAPDAAEGFAQGLLSLERNWRGSAMANPAIDQTLQQFVDLEKAATSPMKLNWRFQQAMYRAYYDAYDRARLVYETQLEQQANSILRRAGELGPGAAMAAAQATLDRAVLVPQAVELRARVFELAEALFQSIRMQLSVPRYQAIAVGRGANLDEIDVPLNDRLWLEQEFTRIRQLPSQNEQLKQIQQLLDRADPGPGGFYDDLGNPSFQPHLVRGIGPDKDPAFYHSSLTGFAERSSGTRQFPRAWWTVAETMFDQPIHMHYEHLDPAARYTLGVVYGPSASSGAVRLLADNDIEVHPYLKKLAQRLDFDLPPAATATGTLNLHFVGEPGRGGAGRNIQVAEVWLVRK